MLKNYLKIAIRSLLKNRTSSIINICGLAIGLSTGILIMLVIKEEYSYDKFHTNLDEIYLMMKNQQQTGQISTGSSSPGPWAASLRLDIPEIKNVARASSGDAQLLRVGDKNIYEKGIYADPQFFDFMRFPSVEGNPAIALQDVGSVVITERTAKKLFGN